MAKLYKVVTASRLLICNTNNILQITSFALFCLKLNTNKDPELPPPTINFQDSFVEKVDLNLIQIKKKQIEMENAIRFISIMEMQFAWIYFDF